MTIKDLRIGLIKDLRIGLAYQCLLWALRLADIDDAEGRVMVHGLLDMSVKLKAVMRN